MAAQPIEFARTPRGRHLRHRSVEVATFLALPVVVKAMAMAGEIGEALRREVREPVRPPSPVHLRLASASQIAVTTKVAGVAPLALGPGRSPPS